jgi:hypothetical protein
VKEPDKNDFPFLYTAKSIETFGFPNSYSFVDISKHNVQSAFVHYETGLYVRNRIHNSGVIRPLTNSKVYGGADIIAGYGDYEQGQERFWRNIFSGSAAVCFMPVPKGPGLDSVAKIHIKTANMLTDKFNLFKSEPVNNLLDFNENCEAYCLADIGIEYAIYFPNGGSVTLDLDNLQGNMKIQWLNISQSTWDIENHETIFQSIKLVSPNNDHWIVIIKIV